VCLHCDTYIFTKVQIVTRVKINSLDCECELTFGSLLLQELVSMRSSCLDEGADGVMSCQLG
jgi:hypothetical protein